MEYIYTALLLHSAGQKISEENVKKVLTASSVKVDEARIKALVSSLEGVNIEEVIKQAAIPTVAAPVAVAKEVKTEAKKEEASPEEEAKKAEEAAGGLASLFG